MKILYIHKKIEAVSGGSKCQEANLFMLKKIAGESQVFVYSKEFAKETKWRRNYNRFCTGRFVNFNKADITNIFNIIEKENVGVVFLTEVRWDL